MYGTILRRNGWLVLRVDHYPPHQYLWHSRREAIRLYRITYNLQGRHIHWEEG